MIDICMGVGYYFDDGGCIGDFIIVCCLVFNNCIVCGFCFSKLFGCWCVDCVGYGDVGYWIEYEWYW